MRQYFDDGSYLDFDVAGNPLGGVDSSGSAYAPSAAVSNQVLDLLSLGIKSVLIGKYGQQVVQQAANPATVAPQAPMVQQAMPLLLLAAAAFVVYKLAAD